MKQTLTAVGMLLATAAFGQEHFNGALIGQRTGVLQASLNPAELVNLSSKWDVHLSSFSMQGGSNTLEISSISGDADVSSLLFSGSSPINGRFDAVIQGPSVAYANRGWAFGLGTRVTTQIGITNIHPSVANAIMNSDALSGAHHVIQAPGNQRVNVAAYGEVAASVAREIFRSADGQHQVNVGLTGKLYFPTTYANASLSNFTGDLYQEDGNTILTNATASATIFYAGPMADSFKADNSYMPFDVTKPNGAGMDFGVNYVWKKDPVKSHFLKLGMAIRDFGSMRYSMDNAAVSTYNFHVPSTEEFNLSVLKGAVNLNNVENYLLMKGYVSRSSEKADHFNVTLPGTFSAYADVQVYRSFYVSGLIKQKLNKDTDNDQLVGQDLVQITPRLSWKNIEVWSSWTDNEFAGVSGGLGARFGGFIIGSGSAITAMASGKEIDLYLGYSFGF